jgi:cobalt-zinc-cadmium efflux system outer membrane protein
MRFGRGASLVTLAVTSAASACTSATTQATIRSAETAAEVRTGPPDGGERIGTVPGVPPDAAIDEAAFERPVDLHSLEVTVLARHPSLVVAGHRVRALAERARAEGSLPAPELMAEVWQVPFVKPYALDKAGMIMFSVRQSFPAAGSLDATAEATALEARAEAIKATSEARALLHQVHRTFADYTEASGLHAAHVAHGVLLDRMVAAARARYATGAPLADVAKADLERVRLDVHIAHEHGMVEEARAKLNGLLARPAGAPLGPPRPEDPLTVRLTTEEAAERAAVRSPDIAAAEVMQRSAQATVRAADREATVPSFMVGLDTFLPVNNTPAGYGVSFSMSLPWLWGAASKRTKSAEQRAHAERASADVARLRVRTDAAIAIASVRAAERQYVLLRDTVAPAAQRALDVTGAGYATGGADILAWLDAARTSLDVAVELASARATLDRALSDLDRAAGEHVPRVPLSTSKEHHDGP